MDVLAQDGTGAGTKITNGYVNSEIQGCILSIMSRRPENLIATIERMHQDSPGMVLILDNHVHSSVFPDTDKHGHIPEYGLFDMNVTSFELQDDAKIQEIVNSVIDFQTTLGLKVLTSPSLAMQEFNDTNAQVSLKMYQNSIKYMKLANTDAKLYLTLVFSEQALNQVHSMAQMLDKLCLLDVDGFYIVVQRQKVDNPMWSSSDTLANLLYLVNTLHEGEYEVVVGYTDLWGVLVSAVGANYIASGWFQTLRQYCQSFYKSSRGGPGIPLYVSEKLMSTVYTNPDLRNIVNNGGILGSRVIDTHYGAAFLENPGQAIWTNEAYALQHWHATKQIISRFSNDIDSNLAELDSLISASQELASQIKAANIALDERHDDRHLGVWKSAIEKYKSGVL
jgi:hypothetical protein